MSKTHPPLSKGELLELLDALAKRLRRRRTVARLYVIGDACMALAYGRNRSTTDVDARVETGHSALLEACHEIARERGLPQNWLNEQATRAIPHDLPTAELAELIEQLRERVKPCSRESQAQNRAVMRPAEVRQVRSLRYYTGLSDQDLVRVGTALGRLDPEWEVYAAEPDPPQWLSSMEASSLFEVSVAMQERGFDR